MKIVYNSIFVILLLSIFSCQKKNVSNYSGNKLELTATDDNDKIYLKWNKINSEDFIRYDVFISNSPIPDPKPNVSLGANVFKLSSISDLNTNFFTDSINNNSNNKVYYRVFAILKNRTIISNEYATNSDNLIIQGSFQTIKFIPELKSLYLFTNFERVTVYNYETNTITVDNLQVNTSKSYQYNSIIYCKYNNIPCIAISYNNGNTYGVDFINPITFAVVHSINNSNNLYIYSLACNDKYMYALYYDNSNFGIVCYDLATSSLIAKRGLNGFLSSSSSNLFFTEDKSMLYFIGYNLAVNYSINNSTGLLTGLDSNSNSNNFAPTYFATTTNGDFFFSTNNGNLYNKNFTSTNSLSNGNTSNGISQYKFIKNNSYILTSYLDLNGNKKLNVNTFPNLDFVKTLTVKSNNNSFSLNTIYIEYDGTNVITAFTDFDQLTSSSIIVIKRIPLNL